VGRIQGILQKAHNQKTGEKRIRFTRFDAVDDQAVADALFRTLENWGRSKGMDTVCGPLGFSDLEREGLLIEGFDELATFEEQYNADYYQRLIENLGYRKEVDWEERKIYLPENDDGKLEQMADYVMKRYNLHFGPAKNKRDFIRRYGDPFFELLDKSYADIYGTVPFTDGMKKMLIDNFNLIIELKYVGVILDEHENVVCLGLCFPSLARALQKSGGKLTPAALLRVLRAIKKPKILDLGLVAVDPEWANRGVATVVSAHIMKLLREEGIEYCETNLNLEDNRSIINMWKRFKAVQHKKRRAYVKQI
jgi:GNAT superfamily N-acetyltransferase